MNVTSSRNKYLSLLLLLGLSGCEAIDLINSVGTVLTPSPSASPGSKTLLQQLIGTPTPTATPVPQIVTPPLSAAPLQKVSVVKPQDPNPLSRDWNLVRQPNVMLSVSSELNPTYDKNRLIDGQLTTSWFAAAGDAASKGKLPTVEIRLPQPAGILGVNLRGNREREEGLKIQEISLLISSAQGVLLNETVALPTGFSDVNLLLSRPLEGATSIRVTLTRDSSDMPGLAEIEVVGRS
jgi:hypothetical protein